MKDMNITGNAIENLLISYADHKAQVWIFTRNGSITTERNENVRKMSEERYLKQRSEYMSYLGEFASDRGYHENIGEDLALFHDLVEL